MKQIWFESAVFACKIVRDVLRAHFVNILHEFGQEVLVERIKDRFLSKQNVLKLLCLIQKRLIEQLGKESDEQEERNALLQMLNYHEIFVLFVSIRFEPLEDRVVQTDVQPQECCEHVSSHEDRCVLFAAQLEQETKRVSVELLQKFSEVEETLTFEDLCFGEVVAHRDLSQQCEALVGDDLVNVLVEVVHTVVRQCDKHERDALLHQRHLRLRSAVDEFPDILDDLLQRSLERWVVSFVKST